MRKREQLTSIWKCWLPYSHAPGEWLNISIYLRDCLTFTICTIRKRQKASKRPWLVRAACSYLTCELPWWNWLVFWCSSIVLGLLKNRQIKLNVFVIFQEQTLPLFEASEGEKNPVLRSFYSEDSICLMFFPEATKCFMLAHEFDWKIWRILACLFSSLLTKYI